MPDVPDTATAILISAAGLLRQQPFDDISFRVLSEQAQMSERTLWRHFPTRSHLLVALAEHLEVREMPFRPFRTTDEFVTSTRERFRAFDAAPRQALVCARASMTSPVTATEPDFLTHAVRAMLEAERPGLNLRDHRRATATLRCFASAQFWAHARLQLSLDGDRAADVVGDVTARTLAALTPGSRPAGTHPSASSGGSWRQ